MDWLAESRELAEAGRQFALATVVRRVAPASAQTGDKALILPDGEMRGWVGGSCAQPLVVAEAVQALQNRTPRLIRLGRFPGASQSDDVVEYPMTCHSGGALEILIEPVLPVPRVVIVGTSPVATTLAELARVTGYGVTRLDTAGEVANALSGTAAPGFVVVATMGDDDEGALAAALTAGVPYVALVASKRRAAVVRETLAGMAMPPEAIDRLRAPAGLDIGAQTQEEIALSILAQITSARDAVAASLPDAVLIAEPSPEAIDPVCGMTVVIATAQHRSELNGETWYFCCAGCKRRFEASPAQFTAA